MTNNERQLQACREAAAKLGFPLNDFERMVYQAGFGSGVSYGMRRASEIAEAKDERDMDAANDERGMEVSR